MSSAAEVMNDTEAKRALYLQQFAFKHRQNGVSDSQGPSGLSITMNQPDGCLPTPPAQSRDATSSSRFYPMQPTNGTILVPNSSPLSHSASDGTYRPSQYTSDGLGASGLFQQNGWAQKARGRVDPLSRPSGFVASTDVNNATVTRPTAGFSRRIPVDDDGSDKEPPRKRPNLRQTSTDLFDAVPDSPEVTRPGQKRKLPSSSSVVAYSPPSSDESLPGPSKSRIIRGQRPTLKASSLEDDPEFKKFAMGFAWLQRDDVKGAYRRSNGNVKEASAMLLDPNFHPGALRSFAEPQPVASPTPSRSTMVSPSIVSSSSSTPHAPRLVGKVKEVDQEREAARAAAKEKAAKSSIYKMRADLDHKSPPPTSAPSSSIHVFKVDDSPVQPRRRGNRLYKQRVESEAEESEDEDVSEAPVKKTRGVDYEQKALECFNAYGIDSIREFTGCTLEQANTIISFRPFKSVEDLENRLQQGRKRAGPAGISPRMFQDCVEILEGYGTVDQVLMDCERIGTDIRRTIAAWTGKGKERESSSTLSAADVDIGNDGALSIVAVSTTASVKGLVSKAPSVLSDGVKLKDYQFIGLSWLNLLHSKALSCILADEMGLGKTVQVISFFAHLKERNIRGPHLIVVPSSTLENWCREFERFAPSISIQTYYAGKEERPRLRENLLQTRLGKQNSSGNPWEVLITTYNLAVGDERDKKFFRKIAWNTCVFDEGHILKNFQSQRYKALMHIDSGWKLLLTGTPLQNNLQELVSLLNFILPDQFGDKVESLRTIFKVKGDSKVSLLAEERVSRAKRMMTPFVLRRRKDQVLKDLPQKTERIEWCEMSALQRSIYGDAMQRSRKTFSELADGEDISLLLVDSNEAKVNGKAQQKKGRGNARTKEKKYLENSSNVLMDLRKAASHPMLFRSHFKDSILTSMTNLLLKEPDFKKRGAIFQYVKEDMEVMTDAELQNFCKMYKSTQRYVLDDDCYLESGKVKKLLELLKKYGSEGRKCLVFSQFTQILDILQVILKKHAIKFLVLTGSTPVDVRQGLVDEFTEDENIPAFLLSTKAGGMGINLTAASVVILFDQDFNPHNDRQAADRAYRIGQKRDVEIIKLISRGTIEEDMLKLGETKLALDEAVAGDSDGDAEGGAGESKAEKIMRSSLMDSLRRHFKEEDLFKETPGDPGKKSSLSKMPSQGKSSSSSSSSKATPTSENRSSSLKKKSKPRKIIDSDSDSSLTDIEEL